MVGLRNMILVQNKIDVVTGKSEGKLRRDQEFHERTVARITGNTRLRANTSSTWTRSFGPSKRRANPEERQLRRLENSILRSFDVIDRDRSEQLVGESSGGQ